MLIYLLSKITGLTISDTLQKIKRSLKIYLFIILEPTFRSSARLIIGADIYLSLKKARESDIDMIDVANLGFR